MASVQGDDSSGLGFGVEGKSNNPNGMGVVGRSSQGVGVQGESDSADHSGVFGSNSDRNGGDGVAGHSVAGFGVFGQTKHQGPSKDRLVAGVAGECDGEGWGVLGRSPNGRAAVAGISKRGVGVDGESTDFYGVQGKSHAGTGVHAQSALNAALIATTQGGDLTALIVNQRGTGNIIIGRDANNAEVFRVLNNGDVQVRGVTLTCDKNAKVNCSTANGLQILEKLAALPIQVWNYKADPTSVCHLGPTAQDFRAAFGLNGDDDLNISSIDAHGVALAAIQGLNERLKAENAQLRAEFAHLESRLAALESKR